MLFLPSLSCYASHSAIFGLNSISLSFTYTCAPKVDFTFNLTLSNFGSFVGSGFAKTNDRLEFRLYCTDLNPAVETCEQIFDSIVVSQNGQLIITDKQRYQYNVNVQMELIRALKSVDMIIIAMIVVLTLTFTGISKYCKKAQDNAIQKYIPEASNVFAFNLDKND
ncbi:Hypothetical_protein [Hexamita inflata]|uniref:Hypothetical_protein n=1 Tax=Hexamita inflata TaxID=28002 RepID=A0AA86UWA1_9EUKA|nr:Hypothetical protein HINF_LOCUS54947 [Hexamita inflata]